MQDLCKDLSQPVVCEVASLVGRHSDIYHCPERVSLEEMLQGEG
jgi:hypothetical protein